MDLRETEMTLFSRYGQLQQQLKDMADTVLNVSEHIARTNCKPSILLSSSQLIKLSQQIILR
jgi:hypothetical protein